MTVQESNDSETTFFNPSTIPVASAPPAPIEDVPIASATAVPIVSATTVTGSTIATQPSQSASNGSTIERTTNVDGSLSIKVTKTISTSDGCRNLRIEEYRIPENMVETVIQSITMTGQAPSTLYLTKIEDHHLPPGDSGNVASGGRSLLACPTPGVVVDANARTGGANTSTGEGNGLYRSGEDTTEEFEFWKKRVLFHFFVSAVGLSIMLYIFHGGSRNSESYTPSMNSPIYNPAYPSYTWNFSPPPTKSPSPSVSPYPTYPPTKSLSPSVSPYPTWDYSHWFLTPSPQTSMYPPRKPSTDKNDNRQEKSTWTIDSIYDKENNHGSAVKTVPIIISPTFTKNPTGAPRPSPNAASEDFRKSNTRIHDTNKWGPQIDA